MRRMVENDIYLTKPELYQSKAPEVEQIHDGNGLEILERIKAGSFDVNTTTDLIEHLLVHGYSEQVFASRNALTLPESEVISLILEHGEETTIRQHIAELPNLPEHVFRKLNLGKEVSVREIFARSTNLSLETAELAVTNGEVDLLLENLEKFSPENISNILQLAVDTGFHVHVAHYLPKIPEDYQERALTLLLTEAKEQIHELFGQPEFVDVLGRRLSQLRNLSTDVANECLNVGLTNTLLDEIKSFDDEARTDIVTRALIETDIEIREKLLTALPHTRFDQNLVAENYIKSGHSTILLTGITWFESQTKKFIASQTASEHPDLIAANLGGYEELGNDTASILIEKGFANKIFDHRHRFPDYPVAELLTKVSPEKSIVVLAESLPQLRNLDIRQAEILLFNGHLEKIINNLESFRDTERQKIIALLTQTESGKEELIEFISTISKEYFDPRAIHELVSYVLDSRPPFEKVKSKFGATPDAHFKRKLDKILGNSLAISPDTIKLLLNSNYTEDQLFEWLNKVSGVLDSETSSKLASHSIKKLTKLENTITKREKAREYPTDEGIIIRSDLDYRSRYGGYELKKMSIRQLERLVADFRKYNYGTSRISREYSSGMFERFKMDIEDLYNEVKKTEEMRDGLITLKKTIATSCSSYPPHDQFRLAQQLYEPGSSKYLFYMLPNTSKEIHDDIAKLILANKEVWTLTDNIESFHELSEDTALHLIKLSKGYTVLKHLDRFASLNMENILSALVNKGSVTAVAKNLKLFPNFTHDQIVKRIIAAEHTVKLVEDLKYFTDLSSEVARELAERESVSYIFHNLNCFTSFDEKTSLEVVRSYAARSNGNTFAYYAEKFTDSAKEILVRTMEKISDERKVLVFLDNLDKFPANLHKEIFAKTIDHPLDETVWLKKLDVLPPGAVDHIIKKAFTRRLNEKETTEDQLRITENINLISEIPAKFHEKILLEISRSVSSGRSILGTFDSTIPKALKKNLPKLQVKSHQPFIDALLKSDCPLQLESVVFSNIDNLKNVSLRKYAIQTIKNGSLWVLEYADKLPSDIHEELVRSALELAATSPHYETDRALVARGFIIPNLKKLSNLSKETLTAIDALADTPAVKPRKKAA